MNKNQSIINKIRKKYNGDMKLGFDTEYSVSKPNFCNRCLEKEKRFINFNKGYSNFCIECEEYIKNGSSNKPIKKYSLSNFLNDYHKNEHFYDNHFNKKNIFLPFFNKSTGVYTVSSYIRKYFGSSNFPKYDYKCHCGYITKVDFFNKKPKCGGRSCRNYRRPQSIKKREREKKKFDNRDKNKDYYCLETGVFFHFNNPNKIKEFRSYLTTIDMTFESYMKKHHNDKLAYCLECKVLIPPPKNLSPLDKDKKIFCCNNHYYDYCRKNPTYGGRGSKARRQKQSNTMKSNIASGKFTPCRNHYTSWGATASLTGKKYRSRWELIYHLAYPHLLYENKRIQYYDSIMKKNRIYIIDFLDPITGNLYEIKPSSEMESTNVLDKIKYAEKYAADNKIKYIFIDENDIIDAYEKIKHNNLAKDLENCIKKLKSKKLKE